MLDTTVSLSTKSRMSPSVLPKGWQWASLGEVLVKCWSGVWGKEPDNLESICRVIRVSDIKEDLSVDYTSVPNRSIAHHDANRFALRSGDLVVVKSSGSKAKVISGRTAIFRYEEHEVFIPSNFTFGLRSNIEICIPEWIFYYLNSSAAKQYIASIVGTTTYPNLKKGPFLQMPLPVPSREIQRRTVTRIEALMAEIKKARQIMIEMRLDSTRIVKAALEELFGNVRYGFKVKDVPNTQIKLIGGVAKMERGKFSYRPRNDPQFFGGKMPWVQIQNIPKDYGKYITTHMDTLNERGVSISKIFPRGTLVLSIAATIGAVGVLDFDACFPDSLVGISPDPNILDSGFLYWQLCFIREHLERIAPAAAQKNINLQILSQLSLWVPPLEEQKSINVRFDGIKTKVQALLESADRDVQLLDNLEQSILERAFRGDL